jgi:hypothetical protein
MAGARMRDQLKQHRPGIGQPGRLNVLSMLAM